MVKTGFIRRNSLELLLNKVEGIQVNQGILGRNLGCGSITVTGTGGSKDPFRHPLQGARGAAGSHCRVPRPAAVAR